MVPGKGCVHETPITGHHLGEELAHTWNTQNVASNMVVSMESGNPVTIFGDWIIYKLLNLYPSKLVFCFVRLDFKPTVDIY